MTDLNEEVLQEVENPELREKVRLFSRKVLEKLGTDTVQGLSLTGPAAGSDYLSGESDIQTVLVVDRTRREQLDPLADLGNEFGALGFRAPLVLTPEDIDSSRNVFPLKYLQIREKHLPLYGTDYFQDIEIERKHLLFDLEREVRGIALRLQQSYVGAGGEKDHIRSVLETRVRELLPATRGYLYVKGNPVSWHRETDIRHLCEQLERQPDTFLKLLRNGSGEDGLSNDRLMDAYEDLRTAVDRLSRNVMNLNTQFAGSQK